MIVDVEHVEDFYQNVCEWFFLPNKNVVTLTQEPTCGWAVTKCLKWNCYLKICSIFYLKNQQLVIDNFNTVINCSTYF